MSRTRIILDVDTGVDDAMAILYALGRPGIELEACTTVFGNTEVENATANTLALLHLCGHGDIPVAQGVGRSLLRPYVNRTRHIHGDTGSGNINLPVPPTRAVKEHAVDLIIRMAHENPGEITLVPVSPLTNIGLAFAKDPSIAKLFKDVVIMGSNVGLNPEFAGIMGVKSRLVDANIHNDPEAASIVMNSGANITLVGVDVTGMVRLNRDRMNWITENGDQPAKTLVEIIEFYYNFYLDNDKHRASHLPRGAGMHDPMAVAVAEDPTLATMEAIRGDIELQGEFTRGQLVADRRPIPGQEPNVRICSDFKVDEFLNRFCEAVAKV
ncbi:MAG: nucleoside hydrolase [Phycisphaeraceae bacterium]|nr:nucleoside hydrolase [Phycisphaeraceae bacterium]